PAHRAFQGCAGLRQSRAVTLDPTVLVLLAAALGIYVRRWRAARAEAGPRGASAWRLTSFCGGVAMLFLALVWPVDRLAGELFVMHMAQHILIVDLASILMILGLTRVILRPITRRVQRLERAAGPFGHPAFA